MKTFVLIGTKAGGEKVVIGKPCDYVDADADLDEITASGGEVKSGKKSAQFELVEMFGLSARDAHKRRKFRAPAKADKDDD